MKKSYISPKASIFKVKNAAILAGSDLNISSTKEENGVANSKRRGGLVWEDGEWE